MPGLEPRTIGELIEGCINWDKDVRFMALEDIITKLGGDFRIKAIDEAKLVDALLYKTSEKAYCLQDADTEVRSRAIKCVSAVVKKISVEQIFRLCKALCDLILSGRKEDNILRDQYRIALTTLIQNCPTDDSVNRISETINTCIVNNGIPSDNLSIKRECLEVLVVALERFGLALQKHHEKIMDTCLRPLALPGNETKGVRYLAARSLAVLAGVISDDLLNRLIRTLQIKASDAAAAAGGKIGGVKGPPRALQRTASLNSALQVLQGADNRTLIRTIGTIAGTVGHRLREHVPSLVELFLSCIGEYDPNDQADIDDENEIIYFNEVREFSFAALEVFITFCPSAILPYLKENGKEGKIVQLATDFIRYDPNLSEDAAEGGGYDQEDGSEEEEDDDYNDAGDDDDTSWKVRRAALKVILAVVKGHPALNKVIHECCSEALLGRFKERANQVRADVLQCFIALLESTRAPDVTSAEDLSSAAVASMPVAFGSHGRARSTVHYLVEKEIEIINGFTYLMNPKNNIDLESRKRSMELLTKYLEVLRVAPGSPSFRDESLRNVVKILMAAFKNDKLKDARLQQLQLLSAIVESHSAESLQTLVLGTDGASPMDVLSVIAANSNASQGYRNVTLAVRLVGLLAPKLRPFTVEQGGSVADLAMDHGDLRSKQAAAFKTLFKIAWPRLEALDQDQEIKKSAIESMSLLVHHGGDLIDADAVRAALTVFVARIENEVTRVTSLRALTLVAKSPVQMDISCLVHPSCFATVSRLTAQQNREVRVGALICLDSIVHSASFRGGSVSGELVDSVLKDISPLISIRSNDLHLAQLALTLCTSLVSRLPGEVVGPSVKTYVFANAIGLARSSASQSPAFQALEAFLSELTVVSGGRALSSSLAMTFEDIIGALYNSTGTDAASRRNLARCIAAVCMADPQQVQPRVLRVVTACAKDIKEDQGPSSPNPEKVLLALLCIGTIGRNKPLHDIVPNLVDLLVLQLRSTSAAIQSDAAFALGNLAVQAPDVAARLLADPWSESGPGLSLTLSVLKELIQVHVQQGSASAEFVRALLPTVTRAASVRSATPASAGASAGAATAAGPEAADFAVSASVKTTGEQIRRLSAECLGLLTFLHPEEAAKALKELFDCGQGADNWQLHWCLATSFLYSVRKGELEFGDSIVMAKALNWLPSLLAETSALEVRKAAAMATNSILHHNHKLLLEMMDSLAMTESFTVLEAIMPHLVRAMVFQKKFMYDTGAFKVIEDLGLPLRLAALTCLDALMEVIPEKLNVPSILDALGTNMGDSLKVKSDTSYLTDIKLYAHRIVIKLCKLSPGSLLGRLEELPLFIEPLRATIKPPTAPAATSKDAIAISENELKAQEELRRSALRVVLHFDRLEGVSICRNFKGFVDSLVADDTVVNDLESEKSRID